MDPEQKRLQKSNCAQTLKNIQQAQDNWLFILELFDHNAKIVKAKYDAALAQGFNETQAVYLSTQTWNI